MNKNFQYNNNNECKKWLKIELINNNNKKKI